MPNTQYSAFAAANDVWNDYPYITITPLSSSKSVNGLDFIVTSTSGGTSDMDGQFDWFVISRT